MRKYVPFLSHKFYTVFSRCRSGFFYTLLQKEKGEIDSRWADDVNTPWQLTTSPALLFQNKLTEVSVPTICNNERKL